MFEQKFEDMLRTYQSTIDDKKRFSGLVKDMFPNQVKNVNLLLMAYNMGIAQDMANAVRINNTVAYRYVKQLVDDYGLNRSSADWIVSVWCVCYGQKILGKPCDISIQKSRDKKPAINAESASGSGKQYGDLFTYRKSILGLGLAATGFTGDKSKTIIFQNRSGNDPVVEIAENSFAGTDMEEVILTEGISVVGNRAFAKCYRLHQAVLPVSIREIGDEAFAGCGNLKSISLPQMTERIGDRAFAGTGLRTIIFPKSLYWIGQSALADCKTLDQISLPENITFLPQSMFEACTGLKKIELHEHLERIEDRAFFGCSSLDFIIIPDSVTYIGENVFNQTDKQFIIQCSFGSYAEEYARKNKIKYQLV